MPPRADPGRHPESASREEISGCVVQGLGRAAYFTQLRWVRRQLIDQLGIDPHPGTLNLTIDGTSDQIRWDRWRDLAGHCIEPEGEGYCRLRCYPVRIAGQIPGAVVLPEVSGYPQTKVELVAALPVRRHLALRENQRVQVELCRPFAVKAVLFDIDGTLVDSVGAYVEVARCAAEQFGYEVTESHIRRALATGSNFWQGLVSRNRHDCEAVMKAMTAHAFRQWPRVLEEHSRIFGGIGEMLDRLARLGIKLGIVSGARSEVLELLRAEGVLDRFDAVLLGEDVASRKPDPEGIVKCLRQLGVAPETAIYVGDTPVDMQASRAAGLRAVGVLTGAGDCASLSEEGADRLISSLSRLPAIIEPL